MSLGQVGGGGGAGDALAEAEAIAVIARVPPSGLWERTAKSAAAAVAAAAIAVTKSPFERARGGAGGAAPTLGAVGGAAMFE